MLASRDAEALCTVDERRRTLQILDVGTTAVMEGEAFLPLRGHFFHRTQSGLWGCCNSACPGRQNTPLNVEVWPFGKLFLERRAHCDTCGSLVFDLVVCTECGTEYLACEEGIDAASGRHLRPRTYWTDYDEFQEEFESIDADDETSHGDSETDTRGLPRLIAPPGWQGVDRVAVDPSTGAFHSSPNASLALGVVTPEPDGGLPCPRCGSRERKPAEVF
jgi:DEAD/DEAH box helicase domain-containing protein